LVERQNFAETLGIDCEELDETLDLEMGLIWFFDGDRLGFNLADLPDALSARKDENSIAYGIERALMLNAIRSIAADEGGRS
jgi:hypothetical protein